MVTAISLARRNNNIHARRRFYWASAAEDSRHTRTSQQTEIIAALYPIKEDTAGPTIWVRDAARFPLVKVFGHVELLVSGNSFFAPTSKYLTPEPNNPSNLGPQGADFEFLEVCAFPTLSPEDAQRLLADRLRLERHSQCPLVYSIVVL